MEEYFSREDTKVIKGIAILLMLMHHLWGFPDRIYLGSVLSITHILGVSSSYYLGLFGKICVSIFFFVGGYGIYKSSQTQSFSLIKKLKGLYINYWKVFLIFIPIAFAFFANQPIYCIDEQICTRYTSFSMEELLNNFLGLQSTYNSEWWFLISYVYAIILYPFLEKVISKFSNVTNICIIVLGNILVSNVFPAMGTLDILGSLNSNYIYKSFFCQVSPFISCFWMGCVFAKGDLLFKFKESLASAKLLSPVHDIVFLLLIIFLRNTGIGDSIDMLYVPLMIICSLDLLDRLKYARKIFIAIGKESTNMWLIHTFFCYYFYQVARIVVLPQYAIPSLVLLVVFTYLASLAVTFFWRQMERLTFMKKVKT